MLINSSLPSIDLLVDLLQDRSIMHAVLAENARRAQPRAMRIILNASSEDNQAFFSSSLGKYAQSIGVEILELQNPLAYANLISLSTVVLSCSESSSRNHHFCKTIVEIAKHDVLSTIAIQHGYECVGLLHHPTQDIDYPYGVILASEILLTWQHVHHLKSLSPFSTGALLPCGPISLFLRTAHHLGIRQRNHNTSVLKNQIDSLNILICDNTQSPRFRLPRRRIEFQEFCRDMAENSMFRVVFRRHPANRMAVSRSLVSAEQIEGDLDPLLLSNFDVVISPPSSILIDAAVLGLPTILWSDDAVQNDTINYPAFSVVRTMRDFIELMNNEGLTQMRHRAVSFVQSVLASDYGGLSLNKVIDQLT